MKYDLEVTRKTKKGVDHTITVTFDAPSEQEAINTAKVYYTNYHQQPKIVSLGAHVDFMEIGK
jgi:1,2-phenylacetyl-CoA epoxidase PaaB subunit